MAESASAEPQRTCVGCRERHGRSALLRVVSEQVGDRWIGQPDPHCRRPGRGAWLHPDLRCLDRAESRGAFIRAFRVNGLLDVSTVRRLVTEMSSAAIPPST